MLHAEFESAQTVLNRDRVVIGPNARISEGKLLTAEGLAQETCDLGNVHVLLRKEVTCEETETASLGFRARTYSQGCALVLSARELAS